MFSSRGRLLWVALPVVFCTVQVAQAQMFFDAEAVFLRRNNRGDTQFIQGPDSVSSSPGYSFEPGYRLTLGRAIGSQLEVDASFMQLNPWESSRSGIFTDDVVFDNSVAVSAAPSGTANTLLLNSAIREASLMDLPGANQLGDAEFLMDVAGPVDATYATSNRSLFREFEVNIGSQRDLRRWRISTGYRHIRLDETNGLHLSGMFDTAATGAGPAVNELSDQALQNAGLVQVSGGAGGFVPYTAGTDENFIRWHQNSRANNELNGAQLSFAYRILDSEWFTVEWVNKVGIYRNNVSGRITETIAGSGTTDAVYQRVLSDSDLRAAFVGNWGLRGVASLTDYINIVCGYNVLYIAGVALGGDQAEGLRTNALGETVYQVQSGNSLFAHGANIGLELLW